MAPLTTGPNGEPGGELSSGQYFTRNVIYYTGPPGNQQYNNEVWGLVALHIIHKTKSFPDFVFATWEQVDDYDDGRPPTLITWRSRISGIAKRGAPHPCFPISR